MDNESLIDAIRGLPCLYNSKIPEFKVRQKKENAWLQVAAEMGKTGECLHMRLYTVVHVRYIFH